jgi:hypothetical protein
MVGGLKDSVVVGNTRRPGSFNAAVVSKNGGGGFKICRLGGLSCSGSAHAGQGEVICAVPAMVAATANT